MSNVVYTSRSRIERRQGPLRIAHLPGESQPVIYSVHGAGEVETEEGVLVIRRIHVAMRLLAPEAARETIERTHGIYAMRCPLYRTLHKTIQLTSSFELVTSATSP